MLYTIIEVKGSAAGGGSVFSGRTITRDARNWKLRNNVMKEQEDRIDGYEIVTRNRLKML